MSSSSTSSLLSRGTGLARTLPRRCKMELLAVKLRTRPSKQELEDRNVFPQRTDEERQEIRQQIEMKLSNCAEGVTAVPGVSQLCQGCQRRARGVSAMLGYNSYAAVSPLC
ncbi:Phosphatase and actin regulator 3 [Tupaia chinensis]|uniref:Phosphatase and actin regulator 3 n=1 Tax=Tupaia chinensis TaxID=246437 RepID=L9L8E7_TUPCH|nr:Phosphatase and actin regulator 3 [Tupaia chinensis]